MTLSPLPEWSRRKSLILLTLAVSFVAAAKLVLHKAPLVSVRLGDSDDAMRLVLVRDLLNGRGWFDQHLTRLQPPHGLYMHWSRLLDGALAGYEMLLRTVAAPTAAEWLMRTTWPLLWLLPTVGAGLAATRRLGGGLALSAGAVLFMLCADSYAQFAPGRIDHHNVQIAFCVVAAAAALFAGERRSAAVLAGAATALGLAVGIEALLFYAVIGAFLSLRFVLGRSQVGATAAYGLSLALTSGAAFLIQTPPDRWSAVACDAVAMNMAVCLVVSGLGLAAAAQATRTSSTKLKALALAGVGLLAAALYLTLDPTCRTGPTAAVDPSIRGIWADSVDEMQPWSVIIVHDFTRGATLAAPAILGLLAWAWVGRRREARSFDWALMGALLAIAVVSTAAANRMSSYLPWFAVPLIACSVTELAVVYGRRLFISGIALAAAFSPPTSALAATTIHGLVQSRAARAEPGAPAQGGDCLNNADYQALARDPPGVVLADPDIGPFILATTRHSVISAPYHRMVWGIRTGYALLHGPGEAQRDAVRSVGVSYVVVCRTRRAKGSESLEAQLEAGAPPSWLQPLSPAGDVLQVYRVR